MLHEGGKVKCGKEEVVHLQSVVYYLTKYLVGHHKVGHVKNRR